MRFSLQVYYAVNGVFDLAYNGFDQPVQVRVVGERQAIPTRYLEQIFQKLRKARIVRGKRGPGGGYVLARDPADITLREIIEAVEGPLVESAIPASGTRASRADAKASPDHGHAQRTAPEASHRPDFAWPRLAGQFAAVLEETTVADLCRDAAREAVERADHAAYSYEI
jgi:Rrf2 family protein